MVTRSLVLKFELCLSSEQVEKNVLVFFCGFNLKWSDGLSLGKLREGGWGMGVTLVRPS